MIIDFVDIPKILLERGVVKSISAANSTSVYAVLWAQGGHLDFSKSQVAVNRARLRKIGLDIAKPYVSPTGEAFKLQFETNLPGY